MGNALNLTEIPQAETMHMLVGWRQWADAGSISSALPQYLIDQLKARHIGKIDDDGFYMFQFPGTHHLMRPVVRFEAGFPVELDSPSNDLYYTEVGGKGLVIFIGDEPQLNVEQYIDAILEAAAQLKVSRIVGFGGVYAEVPYDKERTVSSAYSRRELRPVLEKLAVNFSDYRGGAAIGSVLCYRASQRKQDYASFYAFVPNYDLSDFSDLENTIRIENDFMAWLNVMRRVNHFLEIEIDLSDLEARTAELISVIDKKVDELDLETPSAGLRSYFTQLATAFDEEVFNPLDDVWEDELRRLLDDDE